MPNIFVLFEYFLFWNFLSKSEILPFWPAYIAGRIAHQKYLNSSLKIVFLVYTTYPEILLLGVYSKGTISDVPNYYRWNISKKI